MTQTETTGYTPLYITELFTAGLFGDDGEFQAMLDYLEDPDGYDKDIAELRQNIERGQ